MRNNNQNVFKIVEGMKQDLDVSSQSGKSAFELYNLKHQYLDNNTQGSLTNEKGNTIIESSIGGIFTLEGQVIGIIQCTEKTVVIFTYSNEATQYIYRVDYNEDYKLLSKKVLFTGDLNVTPEDEISGLFVHENSTLEKIYWVDGKNPLRYLNISLDNPQYDNGAIIKDSNVLSSRPTFKINHKLSVERIPGGGTFPAGVIQYAFTYYNLYGAETNIVDISPLYYISEETRGLETDKVAGCSFKVTIQNPDQDFDFIRVYSIIRTSLEGAPIVKHAGDIKITKGQ